MQMICENEEKCKHTGCYHIDPHEHRIGCDGLCKSNYGIKGSKCIPYKGEKKVKKFEVVTDKYVSAEGITARLSNPKVTIAYKPDEIISVRELPEPADVGINDEVRKKVEDKVLAYCVDDVCRSCKYKNLTQAHCKVKITLDIIAEMQLKAELVEPSDVEDELDRLWNAYNSVYPCGSSPELWFKKHLRKFVQSQSRPNIELPMAETGVLDPDLFANKDVTKITFVSPNGNEMVIDKTHPWVTGQHRCDISMHSFPRSFYRDIQSTVDYSKLKVGSVAILTHGDGSTVSGYVNKVNHDNISIGFTKHYSDCTSQTTYFSTIKSIKILALPEVVK